MSSTSFPASADLVSASNGPECEPSRSAKSIRSVGASSPSTGLVSPSTMTFGTSPLSTSPELVPTSYAEDSPAKIFPMPESAPVSMERGPASGVSLGDLLASYDRITRSWKTSQLSLFEGFSTFSETLPICGMTRNGECSALTILEQVNTENASGYWHTPLARDYKGQSGRGHRERRGRNGKLHIANLCDQLVDFGRPDLIRSYTFREWLMGLPIGHTACAPLETPSSRKSRKSSGEQS
jgi:hypothetical protein